MLTRESCAEGWDAKEPCKRDNILQKRPVISRNLLIVATVYILYMYTLIYVYMLTRGSCAEGRDGGGGESRYCVCVCMCECECVCVHVVLSFHCFNLDIRYMCVYMCMCVHVCMCVCVCVRVCVCA